jgi:hypothetical protein|tara:strand:- start:177 stop:1118 length:942 start_codon:yes stop_codon:yes gene_type:complete
MLGQTYYHETIRKYVAVFGTLFNDINIQRTNSAGVVTEQIKVPIAYEAKDKMLLRVRRGSKSDQSLQISLPRMGFDLNAITYDPTRKLNTMGQTYAANNATNSTTLLKQYNPVPYNFDFTLSAMVDNSEDGAQIFEQIVPFFTPEFTCSVNLIPSMNIKPDITIILNDVAIEDSYEGDLVVRREIIWTLNFMLKGYIYPDVKSGSVTKSVIVNLRLPAEAGVSEYIVLEDSTDFSTNYMLLDADAGSPDATGIMKILSESSSDAAMAGIKTRITTTPGANDVVASDDFGYSQTFEYFDNPIDNNPTTGLDVNL